MRYLVLAASLVIQICLGGLYAWSSFVLPLQRDHDLSSAQAQLIFGCLIGTFTISMVAAGKLMRRRGPRLTAAIAGVLFAAGYLTAAVSGGSFLLLFLGIAVLAGIATGFGYVVPLTTCMQWFPRHRGLITGIAMAGFGGGAVVLSNAAEAFYAQGLDVLTLFGWIGVIYGVAILGAAMVMRVPHPPGRDQGGRCLGLAALCRDHFFLALVLGMFAGTFAGLLVIGNLKPLLLSYQVPAAAATASISSFAIGNFLGRITWGWIADRIGVGVIPLSLLVLAQAIGLTPWAVSTPSGAIAISLAIGFAFGACFVIYATHVARRYGPDQVGGIYPFIFLAYGAAGVTGPWLGGLLYDFTDGYTSAIVVSILVVVAGVLGGTWLLYGSQILRAWLPCRN